MNNEIKYSVTKLKEFKSTHESRFLNENFVVSDEIIDQAIQISSNQKKKKPRSLAGRS